MAGKRAYIFSKMYKCKQCQFKYYKCSESIGGAMATGIRALFVMREISGSRPATALGVSVVGITKI